MKERGRERERGRVRETERRRVRETERESEKARAGDSEREGKRTIWFKGSSWRESRWQSQRP